jgi:diguanylate cyclase (GGDEF)-like protein
VRKTVSVGVATFPIHARSGGPLIVAADTAMYVAKRSGKNAVVVAG